MKMMTARTLIDHPFWSGFVAALLLLNSNTLAGSMTFKSSSNGGNIAGSTWIAAEGEITEGSVIELENELNSKFDFAKNKTPYEVHLNSPGGSLIGGIKLGEFFRKYRFNTVVAKTIPDAFGHEASATGSCTSACALAFIGGVERYAESGVLGIHQFYQEMSLKNPNEKIFNALDMSNQQLVGAILIDYVFRMGVDPRFAAIAAATPPTQMHYLATDELIELKANWSPKDFEPWVIEPSGHGLIAFTKTRDKTQTAVVCCRTDKVPRLYIKAPVQGFNWYQAAIKDIESMTALGVNVPKSAIVLKNIGGEPALELPLPGFRAEQLNAVKWIGTGVDGPRYMWPAFSFDLPSSNAAKTMSLALRNCI